MDYSVVTPSVDEYPAPDDLAPQIKLMRTVERYGDPRYPPGMVSDLLSDHRLRLHGCVDSFGVPDQHVPEVRRLIDIHDMPEIESGDDSAVLKSDGLVKETDELTIARELLTIDDFWLFQRYKLASDFLKGKGGEPYPSGLIVKVLDCIDGNLYFHQHVYDWVKSGGVGLPPDTALIYTFNQYQEFSKNIETIDDPKLKGFLQSVLNYQIEYIYNLWRADLDHVPGIMRFRLYGDL